MHRRAASCLLALGLSAPFFAATAAPAGTAFSYQGELREAGAPVSVPHDFEFVLYNVASGGAAIDTLTRSNQPVTAGLFTVELEFTDVPFAASEAYWLEVHVRDGDSVGLYTTLLPRQKITPVPYALNARTVRDGAIDQAALAAGSVGSEQLLDGSVGSVHLQNGAVASSQLQNGAVGSGHLQAGAVETGHLQVAGVGRAQLAQQAVGRDNIEPGAVGSQQIGAGAVLAEHIAPGAVGMAQLGSLSVGSSQLIDSAVDTRVLVHGAVTSEKIADSTVGSIDIENGGVMSPDLGIDAVRSEHIRNGDVIGEDIAAGSIGQLHFGAGQVGTNALADGAVTFQKIADGNVTPEKLSFPPGDVTSVIAGAGLIGGGTGGDVTLSVNSVAIQARITGSCPPGQFPIAFESDGQMNCELMPGIPHFSNQIGAATDVAMAIGADGYPVFSHAQVVAGQPSVLRLVRCTRLGCTTSGSVVVDDPVNAVGTESSIAIGADGFPVISYYDLDAQALKVAKCVNVSCGGATVITTLDDSTSNVGRNSVIAVGGDGLPVIAYQDTTAGAVKLAKCGNPDCTVRTLNVVDDGVNDVGFDLSLVLRSAGPTPIMAYRDNGAQALKVASCNDAACASVNVATVDDPAAASVGFDTSIALDAEGNAVIAYRDVSAAALKVLRCANTACTSVASTTTLDDPANSVGHSASIAVGPDNLPVIAYVDSTASAVKVAKCANTGCTVASSIVALADPPAVNSTSLTLRLTPEGLPAVAFHLTPGGPFRFVRCGTRSCQ